MSIRQAECWLRVAEGSRAALEPLAGIPPGIRIVIGKAATGISSDIQLNQPGFAVRGRQRYAIGFQARADEARSIFVGVAKAHERWSNLGLYRQIELTTQWQSFQEAFTVTEDEDNGRIHFDVGDSEIPVELSSVTFRSLSDGRMIKPAPRSVHANLASDNEVAEQAVNFGAVAFGSLRRVTPISRKWGWDRGLPIDRYYIESFLSRHKEDIRGRVLEIGDNSYTRKFGADRVTVSDVLHVEDGNPLATIVADLTRAEHIPAEIFDGIIFTQTLNRIYDPRAALKTLYRILKPRGVLLATFPGITRTDLSEPAGAWYWSFTSASARRLFEEVFPAPAVAIKSHGNVLAATSFLYGLAKDELSQEELDYVDPEYEVLITVRAVKTEL